MKLLKRWHGAFGVQEGIIVVAAMVVIGSAAHVASIRRSSPTDRSTTFV